jgi:dienelactone hydrolase
LHDIKAVVRFVRGNAAKYKFDTNFVAVSGFSSGGHLSSLTATTCGLTEGKSGSVTVDLVGDLGEYTSFSSCVDGAVLWSPPTDIYTMNPINNFMGSGTYEGAFIGVEREGNKDKWMVASSPYYASEDDPPIIMFHGTSDQIVNIEQSQELYDSLKNHNVVTEFVKVSGGSHGGNEMYAAENLNKAVAFLDKAREAKAAAAVVPPDTSKQDTSVIDTSKTDSLPPDTQSIAIPSLRVPMLTPVSYSVYSLDGTLVSRSSVLNKQALRPGVYYVVSKYNTGERKMFRIVKR